MAIVDKQKFQQVALSLRAAFAGDSGSKRLEMNSGDKIISLTPYIDEQDILDRLDEEAGEEGEEDHETGKKVKPVKRMKSARKVKLMSRPRVSEH